MGDDKARPLVAIDFTRRKAVEEVRELPTVVPTLKSERRLCHTVHSAIEQINEGWLSNPQSSVFNFQSLVREQSNHFGVDFALGLEDASGEGVPFEDRDGALHEDRAVVVLEDGHSCPSCG